MHQRTLTLKFFPVAWLTLLLLSAENSLAAPWRLQDELNNPHIIINGQSLLRFESLDGQYRSGRGDSEQMLIIRHRLSAGITLGHWSLVTELMDARQRLADSRSPISNGMVNTLEFVQTYVKYRGESVLAAGDSLDLKFGKQVMDLGGRRLIASTRFRGSENAFSGLRADWRSAGGTQLTGLFFNPVHRRPSDRDALLDNQRETDLILSGTRFYGASLKTSPFGEDIALEITGLRLDENSSRRLPTAERDITTFGGRLNYTPPSPFSLEMEGYYQWGESKLSPTGSQLLDHRAWFGHVDIGWQFEAPMSPKISLLYDYASGDKDPTDGQNNRFSSLYGVQPPDFGWTGIYGAFIRDNLKSAGIRLQLQPHKRFSVQATLRNMSLAASRDRWVKARLQDASGAAGNNLGSQLNVKAVWKLIPGNLRLMLGYSQLFAGSYQRTLTGETFDTHYGFIETVVDF